MGPLTSIPGTEPPRIPPKPLDPIDWRCDTTGPGDTHRELITLGVDAVRCICCGDVVRCICCGDVMEICAELAHLGGEVVRCTCWGVGLAHLGGDIVRCTCTGVPAVFSALGGDVGRVCAEDCDDDLSTPMGCDTGPLRPPVVLKYSNHVPVVWSPGPGGPGAPNRSGETLRVDMPGIGFRLEGIEFRGKEATDAE